MAVHQAVISAGCCAVTQVKEVEGFSERELRLKIIYGEKDEKRLIITGEGLKIINFSNQSGDLTLVGRVDSIKYQARGEKMIKRLFK